MLSIYLSDFEIFILLAVRFWFFFVSPSLLCFQRTSKRTNKGTGGHATQMLQAADKISLAQTSSTRLPNAIFPEDASPNPMAPPASKSVRITVNFLLTFLKYFTRKNHGRRPVRRKKCRQSPPLRCLAILLLLFKLLEESPSLLLLLFKRWSLEMDRTL